MIAGYKTISNKLLHGQYNIMLNKGLDESVIFRKTGISRADVFSENGRISHPNYMSFLGLVCGANLVLFEPKHLLLPLSEYMEGFGELFGLCLNCATAKEALSQFLHYRDIIGESDLILLGQEDSKVIVQYITEEVTELSSIQALGNFNNILQLLQFYLQDDTIRVNAWFMGGPWFDKVEYADFFKGSLNFNQPYNRMEFDAAVLDSRSPVFNPILLPYLEVQAKKQMMLIQARKSYTAKVYDKVRELLLESREGLGELCADTISQHFYVSRWTLFRKLADEGVTYQKIIADLRREEAVKYLSDPHLAIGEISDRLGFSSPGAFSRFFSHHFGVTPKGYRMSFTHRMS